MFLKDRAYVEYCVDEEVREIVRYYVDEDYFLFDEERDVSVIEIAERFGIPLNEEIQKLLTQIKTNIATGYAMKNQYKNRLFDFSNYKEERLYEPSNTKYCGLPRDIL